MSVSLEYALGVGGGIIGILSFIYSLFRDRSGEITALEHRLTSLEERSLSKEDIEKLHTMQETMRNLVEKVDELCEDYKETSHFVYRDLTKALRKVTAPKYDALLDKLSELETNLSQEDAEKLYKLLKADYGRAEKKEDAWRMHATKVVMRQMERDFGLGEGKKRAKSIICGVAK